MTRTRATTQAKKTSTAAKKTAATKATTSRPARKTTKKTAAPRLSPVKPTPAPPKRPHDFMTDVQGYATLAARIAGIPTHRIPDWHDHLDGTATRPLADGSHLHYTLATRTLRWQALCPMGAIHEYVLDSPSAAAAARVHADRCCETHATFTHIPRLTRDELTELGIHTGPTWARPDLLGEEPTQSIPVPGDALTRATASAAETQPIPTLSAEDLAARADHDHPKEHPHD